MLGGAWALGAFDNPAPVAEVAAPIPTDVASTPTGPTTIDVAQIYRRSAPGVVQIVSTSRGARAPTSSTTRYRVRRSARSAPAS